MKKAEKDPLINDIIEKKEVQENREKEILEVSESGININLENVVIIISNDNLISALYKDKLITFKARPSRVTDFSMFNGRLCDIGEYHRVHDTFDDSIFGYIRAGLQGKVNALCELEDELYCGAATADGKGLIYNPKGDDIMRVENPVTSLCAYGGELYFGDSKGFVYESKPENIKVSDVKTPINALCDYQLALYCAYRNRIRITLAGKEKIRPGKVNAICHYGKTLFDGGKYGIYDMLFDIPIYDKTPVEAMICIPEKLFVKEFLSKCKIKL